MVQQVYYSEQGWLEHERDTWNSMVTTLDSFSSPQAALIYFFTVMMPFAEDDYGGGLMEWQAHDLQVVDDLRSDVDTVSVALTDCENANMAQGQAEEEGVSGPLDDPNTVGQLQDECYEAIMAINDILYTLYTDPAFSGDTSSQQNAVASATDLLGYSPEEKQMTYFVDGQQQTALVPQFTPANYWWVYENWTGQTTTFETPNVDSSGNPTGGYHVSTPEDQNYQVYVSAMQKWSSDISNLNEICDNYTSQDQAKIQYYQSQEKQLLGSENQGFQQWEEGVKAQVNNLRPS